MNILADEMMPLVDEYFSSLASVRKKTGRDINPEDIKGIDALLVRSGTKVNSELFKFHTPSFVGTATIGTDHLDLEELEARGVCWSSAAGCNAVSVAEFVISTLAFLTQNKKISSDFCALKAGVVGLGNVGKQVAQRLALLGFEVLQNDPPRAEKEPNFKGVDLEDLYPCDILCLHAPITKSGDHPSYHLINEEFLSSLKTGCVIISAGRGAVVDFEALEKYQQNFILCLDVWEPEPAIPTWALKSAYLATPHIAGHSIEGKWRGTYQVYQALCAFLQKKEGQEIIPLEKALLDVNSCSNWQEVCIKAYNPNEDSERLKSLLTMNPELWPSSFDALRKNYPIRREYGSCDLKNWGHLKKEDQDLLLKLGFDLI